MSLRRAIQMVLVPCVVVLALGSAMARPRELAGLSLFFEPAAQSHAARDAGIAPSMERSEDPNSTFVAIPNESAASPKSRH